MNQTNHIARESSVREIFHEGGQALVAMLELIFRAQKEILLEMYWFADDKIGQRFSKALIDATKRGVKVHVIYDSLGSWESSDSFWEEMRDKGVFVNEYNALAPWKRKIYYPSLFKRNHRKVLIVDRSSAVVGGVNICDEEDSTNNPKAWRDSALLVEGQVVSQLAEDFFFTDNALTKGLTWALRRKDAKNSEGLSQGSIIALSTRNKNKRRDIRSTYATQIQQAKEKILFTNAYFIPDRFIRRELVVAKRRGVDIKVIVPSKTDSFVVALLTLWILPKLIKGGIEIYLWQPTMMHAKTATIDSRWSTIGSYNLDFFTPFWNLEVSIAIEDTKVAAQLETQFLEDQKQCKKAEGFWSLFRELFF